MFKRTYKQRIQFAKDVIVKMVKTYENGKLIEGELLDPVWIAKDLAFANGLKMALEIINDAERLP